MKKYISSPLCSAIIVPGFGQVLNGQIKKGLIFMGVTFVIFIAGVIKLTQVITRLLPELNSDELNIEGMRTKIDLIEINMMDNSIMILIIIILLIVWIYSIIDAFINGIKIEKERKRN